MHVVQQTVQHHQVSLRNKLVRFRPFQTTQDRMVQGRRIRGFEGAQSPPERGSAPSHCQKHPLKMKEDLMKHRFKTDIHQSYGSFDVHIRLISV